MSKTVFIFVCNKKIRGMDLLGTTFSVNGKVHDLILGVYALAQLSAEDIIRIKKRGIEQFKLRWGISSEVDWFI